MVRAFAAPMGIALLACALPAVRRVFAKQRPPVMVSAKDGFLLVFLTWAAASVLGALPYYLAPGGISFSSAVFESACGFATTGGTALRDVEALPRSLHLWRALTHWCGGMGIVVLAVALTPLLGVGGFQLVKAEAPGPDKEKVTPKIAGAAKFLWIAYVGLTLILTALYALGGMDWFDAFCHACATMSSGGVSTKNAGVAWYNSPFIEWTATVFMLLTGINYYMFYRLIKGRFRDILANSELRAYLGIFIIAAGIVSWQLLPVYGSPLKALRFGAYQTAAILSTTGGAIADYEAWPKAAAGVLFCLSWIGGCSGSTAGGVKVIRLVVLAKQAGSETRRILYPRGVFNIRLNKKLGRRDVVYGTAGFIFLYMGLVTFTALAAAASGTDIFSSFSAALAVAGNVGAGFGRAGPWGDYSAFPDYMKWLFSFVMIAGRLELWTVLVLFTPEYWRR
jgi:trk system potassium uptake protein TrkH